MSLNIAVVGWHTHNKMFDEIGGDLRKAGHRIVRYPDRETFAKTDHPLADADILLCVGNCPVPRAVLVAAPRLRAVVSEATVMMILGALYDFNGTQDLPRKFLPRPDPLRAHQLRGKTLGFIGLGKIGRETVRLLAPWGAVMQYSARRDADLTGLPPLRRVEFDELLRTSDVVVVLASLNDETRGLLNAAKLRLMKKTAILVNMARGGIVDEPALIAALRDGVIAGAAIDVFAVEPLPADSPLRSLPNVILTPHMIGHTYEAHHSLEVATRQNLDRVLAGQALMWSTRRCCRRGARNGAVEWKNGGLTFPGAPKPWRKARGPRDRGPLLAQALVASLRPAAPSLEPVASDPAHPPAEP